MRDEGDKKPLFEVLLDKVTNCAKIKGKWDDENDFILVLKEGQVIDILVYQ